MSKIKSEYIAEMIVTQIWPEDFPAFRLEVPDGGSGIFLGSAVVDSIIAKQMEETLAEARKKFDEINSKK